MEYIRVVPDFDSDPAVEAAGWCAARVFGLLLRISGLKDLRGRIGPEYQSPSWLARRWNLQPDDLPGVKPEDFISNGVARLFGAGLLVRDGEAWLIRGWDKFYKKPKTGAERTAEYEGRLRNRRLTNAVSPDAPDETDVPDATHVHTPHTPPTLPTHIERAAPERPSAPFVPEKPEKPDDAWDGMDFWAWAQATRKAAGLQPERRPNERTVSAWWSVALMQGLTPRALRVAFVAFGNDPYWTDSKRKPPCPFGGFISQWERFVVPEVNHAAG